MKQLILILIVVSLSSLNSYSQTNVIADNDDNFYKKAFSVYLDSLESYFAPIIKLDSKELDSDWHRLKIKKDEAITYFLKDTFNSYKVELFDSDTLISILDSPDKKIILTEITPIKIKKDKLEIDFIDFEVSFVKDSLSERIVSGCSLEYRFDCDLNEFVLFESAFWFIDE
ncbi:hypothetical protein EV201_0001 [Ancylomarina subtilis]|uniref:Uncharacterized protein n=1 Tax=Ancylomarina subtilis TaxID=1639035 RepID=A0A4Q7VH34_9BACT|nr:hypothetical protein [Ancylomarina subtilis]RZT95382.1 hypothetical protein EV201_0001 [Ancylomarina subtilis]